MIHLEGASLSVPAVESGRAPREHPSNDSGDQVILHPVSLSLSEQRIALIGPNGSGKSTLARLIAGLAVPTTGRVILGSGAEAIDTRAQGKQARARTGFLFTQPAAQLIMPTALEDVALSLRRRHRTKRERVAAAHEVLARFRIEQLADRSVHTLSGGQQQLLAIASVLATDPEIVIADEPTTLLDLRNSREIADTLFRLPQQLVVATHDLELAARCDRALLIESGRIVLDGEPERVISHYRETA